MAKILLVDDDEDILVVAKTALELAGHEAVMLNRPREAVVVAEEAGIDAAVLDVTMPEMSGFEVLAALRRNPATGGLPVLFLSAMAEPDDRIRGLRGGADDYLGKPFEPEELVLRVERLVAQSRRTAGGVSAQELSALLASGKIGSKIHRPIHLGRYQVLEILGDGAMGLVLRGYDPLLKRPVAIKTLRVERLSGDAERCRKLTEKLLREAETIARLNHPNLVTVYDVGGGGNIGDSEIPAYLVMEYVAGTSLVHWLQEHGDLDPRQTATIALALTRALRAAHSRKVVHRDVKPGNVLLGVDGSIKLGDFGIAEVVSTFAEGEDHLFGTPGFIPPETLFGEGYGEPGDYFGLGVTLYQCLTGKAPFGDHSTQQILLNTLSKSPPPPHTLDAAVPEELSCLVEDLLTRDPLARAKVAETLEEKLVAMGGEAELDLDLGGDLGPREAGPKTRAKLISRAELDAPTRNGTP